MRKLQILYHTPYFSETLLEASGFSPALAEDLCTITTDHSRIDSADAVVFHIPSLGELPRIAKRPGQFWVSTSMESEANYPRQNDPDFMRHFDITMSFKKDADIPMLYFNPSRLEELKTPPKWKFRRAPASYFASNLQCHNDRNGLVLELMQHMRVDSYGKCQNNRQLKRDEGRKTKFNVISRYLFNLAFENSNCVDYVTEKVYAGLLTGTVPVYLGAPNVDEYLPSRKCIIKVSDFKNAAELARYLIALKHDRAEYRSYLAWRKEPLRQSFLDLIEPGKTPPLRRLCHKIHELAGKR